jgi:hypothetical protein
MEIDWFNIPYNHSWQKSYQSIMNPADKITFPQFFAECIVWLRRQVIKNYKEIQLGPGWSNSIQRHVRTLNQQAAVICNYFPSPKDDPLVEVAFKNFLRRVQPLKIGQYRKVRSVIRRGRQVSTITQDEKDIITGIMKEYMQLKEQRDIFKQIVPQQPTKPPEEIKFKTTSGSKNKKNIASLIELENKLNRGKDG